MPRYLKNRKVDATGRSTGQLHRKEAKVFGPPTDRAWFFAPIDMLADEVLNRLSGGQLKYLLLLIRDHFDNVRQNNGRLILTHKQAHAAGIYKDGINKAREGLIVNGLVKVTAPGGAHGPTLHRLTMFASYDGMPPTHDYLKIVLSAPESRGGAPRKAGAVPPRRTGAGQFSKSQTSAIPTAPENRGPFHIMALSVAGRRHGFHVGPAIW